MSRNKLIIEVIIRQRDIGKRYSSILYTSKVKIDQEKIIDHFVPLLVFQVGQGQHWDYILMDHLQLGLSFVGARLLKTLITQLTSFCYSVNILNCNCFNGYLYII